MPHTKAEGISDLGQRVGDHVPKWVVKQMTSPLPEQKASTRDPTFGHQIDPGPSIPGDSIGP